MNIDLDLDTNFELTIKRMLNPKSVINTSEINLTIDPTSSYSSQVNQRFFKSDSHYVSLETLIDTVSAANNTQLGLQNAMTIFNRKHSYEKWSDILLCECKDIPLSDIMVDTTLQRQLDINHLIGLITKFDQYAVNAIRVYRDAAIPDKFIAFDGMHTACMLYLIAKNMGLENDLDNCIVPGSVYTTTEKHEVREKLIYMNTVSSKRFDPIDLYHQMLFGVRTDCNYQDYWLLADAKQKILEKSNMFATHAKFGDTDKPGALHTMTEFLNDAYSLTVTENFCEYFSAVCDAKRPVDTKESWLLYSFFDACEKSKITVDSAYIKTVADTLNAVMGGKFDVIKFMNYGTNAYNEWFRNVISTTGTLQGIQRPEKKIGNVYLHAVLEKHTSLELPVPQPSWTPYPSHII